MIFSEFGAYTTFALVALGLGFFHVFIVKTLHLPYSKRVLSYTLPLVPYMFVTSFFSWPALIVFGIHFMHDYLMIRDYQRIKTGPFNLVKGLSIQWRLYLFFLKYLSHFRLSLPYKRFFNNLKKDNPKHVLYVALSAHPYKGLGDEIVIDTAITQILLSIFPQATVTVVPTFAKAWSQDHPRLRIMPKEEFLPILESPVEEAKAALKKLRDERGIDYVLDHKTPAAVRSIWDGIFPVYISMPSREGIIRHDHNGTKVCCYIPFAFRFAFSDFLNNRYLTDKLVKDVTGVTGDWRKDLLLDSDDKPYEVKDSATPSVLLNLFSREKKKNWRSLEPIVELIARIVSDFKFKVVLPAGLNEEQDSYITQVVAGLPADIRGSVSIAPESGLKNLKRLLLGVDYIITVDTGLGHIAGALGKRPIVLTLFFGGYGHLVLRWHPTSTRDRFKENVFAFAPSQYSVKAILNRLRRQVESRQTPIKPTANIAERLTRVGIILVSPLLMSSTGGDVAGAIGLGVLVGLIGLGMLLWASTSLGTRGTRALVRNILAGLGLVAVFSAATPNLSAQNVDPRNSKTQTIVQTPSSVDQIWGIAPRESWAELFKALNIELTKEVEKLPSHLQPDLSVVKSFMENPTASMDHISYIVNELPVDWRNNFINENLKKIFNFARQRGLPLIVAAGHNHIDGMYQYFHPRLGSKVKHINLNELAQDLYADPAQWKLRTITAPELVPAQRSIMDKLDQLVRDGAQLILIGEEHNLERVSPHPTDVLQAAVAAMALSNKAVRAFEGGVFAPALLTDPALRIQYLEKYSPGRARHLRSMTPDNEYIANNMGFEDDLSYVYSGMMFAYNALANYQTPNVSVPDHQVVSDIDRLIRHKSVRPALVKAWQAVRARHYNGFSDGARQLFDVLDNSAKAPSYPTWLIASVIGALLAAGGFIWSRQRRNARANTAFAATLLAVAVTDPTLTVLRIALAAAVGLALIALLVRLAQIKQAAKFFERQWILPKEW